MRLVRLLFLFALAACGADGPPEPRGAGVEDAEARIGVVGTL